MPGRQIRQKYGSVPKDNEPVTIAYRLDLLQAFVQSSNALLILFSIRKSTRLSI